MIDRKKVIKGLRRCSTQMGCTGCPYKKLAAAKCSSALKREALELLKDQEPKLVDNIQIRTLDTVGDCPSCGIGVSKRYHPMHCGLCGQAVKWNE